MKFIAIFLLSIPSLLSAGYFTGISCCGCYDESSRPCTPRNTAVQRQEHAAVPRALPTIVPIEEDQDRFFLNEGSALEVLGTPALQATPTLRLQPLAVAALEPATQPSPTQGAALPSNRVQERKEDESNDSDSYFSKRQSREDGYQEMNRTHFSMLCKETMNNEEEILKLLKERNDPTDYDTQLDCQNNTILHRVCLLGYGDVVEKIVKDIGNDYDKLGVRNPAGLSPFDIAYNKKKDGPQYERIWRCLTDAIATMRARRTGPSNEQEMFSGEDGFLTLHVPQ